MRIVEENKIPPAFEPVDTSSLAPKGQIADDLEAKNNKPKRHASKHRRHVLAKFLFAILFMFAVIGVSLGYLVIFIAGPLVKSVDAVPADFPKELALYELDQAKIKVQSADSKLRLSQLLSGLPAWSLEPFIGYLTTDLKTQIAAGLKDPNLLPKNLSIADLSKSENLTKTVSLKWNDISKTKEELFDYYKKQLASKGFTVNEKLRDTEIDLSFFKPGIDGAMTIADNFMKDNSSMINMTVDYLSKN